MVSGRLGNCSWGRDVFLKESDMWNGIIKASLLLVVGVLCGQGVCGDVNDLAAESLGVYKRVEEIKAQRNEATREQGESIRQIESRLNELRPSIIEKYNSRIKNYTVEIELLKKKIAELQRKIDEFKNTDPEQRKAEESRLEAELGEVRAREQQLGKPFDDKIEQLKRIAGDKRAAFSKAIEEYCLIPGQQYGEVSGSSVSATFGDGLISCRWNDANRKQVAWAHIRLRDKPVVRPGVRKLDDTYYVTTHSDSSIWLWAGHFQICFVMSKQEWQGKERLAEAVKQFIDLKGLAMIDAAPKVKEKGGPVK